MVVHTGGRGPGHTARTSGGAAAPPAPGPPPPPDIVLTPGNTQVSIAWTDGFANPAITSHKLYRGTTPGGEVFITSIPGASPYVDTGLTNGTVYYYKLSAVNASGEGALSAEASATPAAVA